MYFPKFILFLPGQKVEGDLAFFWKVSLIDEQIGSILQNDDNCGTDSFDVPSV